MGWYQASDGQWYESADPPQPGWWLASDGRWYAPVQAPKKKPSLGEVVLALSVAGTVMIAALLVIGLVIGPQDKKVNVSASESEPSTPKTVLTTTSTTTAPTTTASASTTTSAPATTAPPATTSPPESAPVTPAVECQSRPPANGEILARSITTDEPPWVDPLGGGWVWSFSEEECITSIEMILGANPSLPGFCTQVALVADNPGYDPDQRPAPPLRNVIAVAGDC